jgi:hypothetical protein
MKARSANTPWRLHAARVVSVIDPAPMGPSRVARTPSPATIVGIQRGYGPSGFPPTLLPPARTPFGCFFSEGTTAGIPREPMAGSCLSFAVLLPGMRPKTPADLAQLDSGKEPPRRRHDGVRRKIDPLLSAPSSTARSGD